MVKFGKIIFLITFLALTVQSPFLFGDKFDELVFIPLTLILAGIAVYMLSRNPDREDADYQVNIFLLAFSVRLWAGFIFYGWNLSSMMGDEDASGYISGWNMAQNWYRNGLDGFFSDLYTVFFLKQNIGQSIIWGIPMYISGGPSRMMVSVINSFAGSLLVIVIYKICQRIFDSQTAKVAALLVTFWASIVLFSIATAKEMLVILFEWTLLYIAIRNPKGLTLNDGLFAIPAFLALYITRFYALYICVSAMVFRVLISDKANIVRNAVLGAVIISSILIFLSVSGVMTRDFEKLDVQNKSIDQWRSNMAGSSGPGIDIYSEYKGSSVAVPVAVLYFFFAPFPWELVSGSMRSSFAAVENVIILYILIVGIPAIKIFFKEKLIEMAPILVFCVMYSGFQIWGLSNVGLAWRHKQTVMPLFFMLIALTITQRKIRQLSKNKVSNNYARI